MSRSKPCRWNDTLYPSIEEAARACRISRPAMVHRLNMDYTCDADLQRQYDKSPYEKPRDPDWYTVEPTPTRAFCDIPILGTVYYIYRQPALKFCSSRHAQYYALYGKNKCERRYKGRWVRGA